MHRCLVEEGLGIYLQKSSGEAELGGINTDLFCKPIDPIHVRLSRRAVTISPVWAHGRQPDWPEPPPRRAMDRSAHFGGRVPNEVVQDWIVKKCRLDHIPLRDGILTGSGLRPKHGSHQGNNNGYYNCKRNTHPYKIPKLVTTGTVDQQVSMMPDGSKK